MFILPNRRMFDRWEDYWSHRLHPVYFGRSVTKRPYYIPPKETSPFILEAMTQLDDELSDNATATDSYVKKLLEEAQATRNAHKSGDTVSSPVPLQVERYPMVCHTIHPPSTTLSIHTSLPHTPSQHIHSHHTHPLNAYTLSPTHLHIPAPP